jgi:hypothetical protein
MAQINPRTFADAIKLGDNIYELILTNWGNRGQKQDADNGSIQYPPVKTNANGSIPIEGRFMAPLIPSVYAIAISPRSDIDRCILHFNSLPQTPPSLPNVPPSPLFVPPPLPQVPPPGGNVPFESGFVNRGGILETEFVLNKESPLIGVVPGPFIVRADPAHWYSDTYLQLTTGASLPYGTAMNSGTVALPDTWTNPELRLLLYMSSLGALPTGRRAPFHRAYTYPLNVPQGTMVVPIAGRRNISVSVRNIGGSDFDLAVSGTFHQVVEVSGPVFASHTNEEVEMLAATTVPAGESAVFQLCNPGVSFMLVKTSAIVIAGVSISIDAFD